MFCLRLPSRATLLISPLIRVFGSCCCYTHTPYKSFSTKPLIYFEPLLLRRRSTLGPNNSTIYQDQSIIIMQLLLHQAICLPKGIWWERLEAIHIASGFHDSYRTTWRGTLGRMCIPHVLQYHKNRFTKNRHRNWRFIHFLEWEWGGPLTKNHSYSGNFKRYQTLIGYKFVCVRLYLFIYLPKNHCRNWALLVLVGYPWPQIASDAIATVSV